jgi:hypothetical protein
VPAAQMQGGLLRWVVVDAMPRERRLAADMQTFEASLQECDAWVQSRGTVGATIDTAREPLEPACADIVDRKVWRYPEGSKVVGTQRRPGRDARIKAI